MQDYKVADICELISRGKAPAYEKAGRAFAVKSAQVYPDSIRWSECPRVSEIFAHKHNSLQLKVGDILVNGTGTGTLGRPGLVEHSLPAPFIPDSHVTLLRVDSHIVLAEYLFLWLLSPNGQGQISQAYTGSTNQIELSAEKVGALSIRLPSLKDQENVVAQHRQIRKMQALVFLQSKQMDLFRETIFGQFFSDDETVLSELVSVCEKVVDCPHSTPIYLDGISNYPCVRSSDIQNGRLVWDNTRYVNFAEFEKRISRHQPQPGDVIYCREGARFGNAAEIPPDVTPCLGQRMMILIPDPNKVTSEFLASLLNSRTIYEQAVKVAGGSASPHVNVADVKQFKFSLPPKAKQKEFSEIIRRAEAGYARLAHRRRLLLTLEESFLFDVTSKKLVIV